MSQDSGISTFRASSNEKLSQFDENDASFGNLMRKVPLEDACYGSKPASAWFYDAGYRREIMKTTPHAGYSALLQLLTTLNKPYFIVTTNIDRYFAKVGFPEKALYEAHGSVDVLQCIKKGPERCKGVWKWTEDIPLPKFNSTTLCCDLASVPTCIYCGGMARCNVSHFPDDPSDIDGSIKHAQRQEFLKWLRKNRTALRSNKTSKSSKTASEHGRLLVLEMGSGDSPHGLRSESELLLSSHPVVGFGENACFVRIDPFVGTVPASLNANLSVSINTGAKPALLQLARKIKQRTGV